MFTIGHDKTRILELKYYFHPIQIEMVNQKRFLLLLITIILLEFEYSLAGNVTHAMRIKDSLS